MRNIQKIMLISPKSVVPSRGFKRLATPLGLLYMGSVLKRAGYEVEVLDSSCEGYDNVIEDKGGYVNYGLSNEDLEKRLLDYRPDLIGVSSPCSARHKKAEEVCKVVKKTLDIPVIMGGLHPSLFPKKILQKGLTDYLILGEGEFRMKYLIESLNKNQEPNFDGIAYKKNREILVKPSTTKIMDLDSIPLPARELINMKKYFEVGMPFAPYSKEDRVEQILTSRGCPGKCNFCATIPFWGRKFRMRSVDNVIDEIDELVNKYGVEELQFTDDNLTMDKNRANELFERMKSYNLSWCTPQGLMTQTLDEKMIKLMADSGAYQITVAIESGSKRVLKEIIHKKVPEKEEVKKIVESAHDNGIQVHAMFVVGFPGEKRAEIYQTLRYPFEIGFDSVVYSIASPVPGSELYKDCLRKGYINKDNLKMDFKTSEIKIPKSSLDYYGMSPEELGDLVEKTTEKFNKFSKEKNPNAWNEKFAGFLHRHPEKAKNIVKRIP